MRGRVRVRVGVRRVRVRAHELAREGGRDRVLYYAFHAVRDKMHRELTKLHKRPSLCTTKLF